MASYKDFLKPPPDYDPDLKLELHMTRQDAEEVFIGFAEYVRQDLFEITGLGLGELHDDNLEDLSQRLAELSRYAEALGMAEPDPEIDQHRAELRAKRAQPTPATAAAEREIAAMTARLQALEQQIAPAPPTSPAESAAQPGPTLVDWLTAHREEWAGDPKDFDLLISAGALADVGRKESEARAQATTGQKATAAR